MTALPTRRDEAWRYADIDAVARGGVPGWESVVVPAGGVLERAIVQDRGGIVRIAMALGREARADLRVLNTGGPYGRIELQATLHEGADFSLGAVQIGGGSDTLEVVTTITHAEPGATSRQVVRTIVGQKATGTYLGKVAVARDAQQTDSEQDVKAMLLDRTATANAKPELEIYADDVKCAHGCAIGGLDPAALFYLQSRGLPPAAAKSLLLEAFATGVFDGAAEEEALKAAALARLGDLV
jgi:Fe-S cluster assembly protein SufD